MTANPKHNTRSGTKQERIERVLAMLAQFDTNPYDIMAMLRTTRSIVSGSVALLMISDMDFEPGDIDIYVPTSQSETALAIAQGKLGFEVRHGNVPAYDNNSGIKRVVHLQKGEKWMNIIVVKGEDPTAAVFQFHSTVVMNYLTAFGLYCAYPSLTLKRLGVANLPALLREVSTPGRSADCFEKYRDRGINIENDVTKFVAHAHHECHTDPECPHTVRSTRDGKGLYIELFPQTAEETAYASANGYLIIWSLGGPMCSEGDTFFENVVVSVKASQRTVSFYIPTESSAR
ncbi:hypothetical protein FB451DRAFT_1029793 [Mycena latifolia]|nr:hypothetical protein FB451DRAFT_1029793 [Mycena latifolia]